MKPRAFSRLSGRGGVAAGGARQLSTVELMSDGSESDPSEQTLEAPKTMKAVVIGEPSGMSMEETGKNFRDKAVWTSSSGMVTSSGSARSPTLVTWRFSRRALRPRNSKGEPFILEGVVNPTRSVTGRLDAAGVAYGSEPSQKEDLAV